MTTRTFFTTLLCAASMTALAQDKAAADGFVSSFNGKTMTGWKNPYEWGQIEVKDGEIHLTGEKKFFVITEKSYSDFVFEGDVFIPEGKANSGFIFRGLVQPNKVWGYQAEVDGDANRKWSGGLYDEGRRMWFVSPIKGNKESEAAFRAVLARPSSATTGTPTASPARARRSRSRSMAWSPPTLRTTRTPAAPSPSSTTARRGRPTSSATCGSKS